LNSTQLNPELVPDLNANHVPPPTAAFAIPLSFLAAILLASVFLCLHHRRKLNEERALEKHKLNATREKHLVSPGASSRVPSVIYLSSSAGSDYMYAPKDAAQDDIYTPVYKLSSDSFPSTYSHARRESAPRTSTRQAFPIPATIVTAPTLHYKRSSYDAPSGFNTSNSIPSGRATKVPASLFKAHKSPVIHPPPGLGRQRDRRGSVVEDKEENASVNHSVISDYMAPSPVPPCLSPGMPAKPRKLYVRNGVDSLFDPDTTPPTNHRARYSDQAAYEVVDNVIRSKFTR
jgi:hypothetical protein